MMIGVSNAQEPSDKHVSGGSCLLGPIDDETARRRAVSIAHALAADRGTELLVSATDADAPGVLPESHRERHCSSVTPVEPAATLDPIVDRYDPSVMVVKRRTDQRLFEELFSDRAERLSTSADVLTVDGRGETDRIASVLIPIAGGDHSRLAVEAGVAVARANDAAVDLFHVVDGDDSAARDRGRVLLEAARDAVATDGVDVDTWLYEAPDAPAAITEQSQYYDLTVMGAPTNGPLERFVFGSTSKQVQREADSPVIVAHAGGGTRESLPVPEP
ncbi:universal stress protein [Halohasta salina]|uniref:universal stress protein n=1 Tax=Halohasta salina TaxID=2961621 RepID=UPI0020A54061|nr:universal stress protein [Halohasta salina]